MGNKINSILLGISLFGSIHGMQPVDIDQNKEIQAESFWIEVRQGNIDAVKRLIREGGVNVNTKNSEGWTALMLASAYGYKDIVEFLINIGADLNIQNNVGNTALILAKKNHNTKIIQLLFANGADYFLRD